MVSARDILGAGAAGAFAVGALGGCEAILRLASGDRFVDPHLSCSGGTCVCTGGFGNCDGNEDNGCEADLSRPESCGACGNVCAQGACVAGHCACNVGFADCDANPANGCESEAAKDAVNCGACGHRCLGGACQGGVCQPATVGGLDGAESIAATSGAVLAARCGAPPIASAADDGPGATPAVQANGCARFVSIAANQIFWATDQLVFSNPLDMVTTPTQLADLTSPKSFFAASPTHVYWWTSSATAKALVRVPLAGGAVEKIVDGTLDALAVDPTTAYWSDATGLHSVPFDGTTITPLSAIHAYALAADGTDLYVGDANGIERLSVTGGAATQLAPAKTAAAIAVDTAHVYWADHGDASVKRVGRDGSGLTVLAQGEPFAAGTPIAIGDQAVYWIAGQAVRRLAR